MSELRRCPQCDAEIPANSPAGLCPRCLLKASADSQSAAASVDPGPTKLTPPNSGFEPPTVEELAPLFPQLEILELLGKGGMGAVYKARQPGLDRLVALKILPPEISHDPSFAERFQREARALARLSHPHIVAVYDFGQTPSPPPFPQRGEGVVNFPVAPSGGGAGGEGQLCYIVMEYIDGANLRQTIRVGRLAAAEALAIVPQICEALQFAHDEGIVHRDIKPENILIDKRGRVKIADFGLAKLLGTEASDHSLTATHQVMGTLRYMAPEQMQGSREVDHRADIYSLGVVFYELLTGELPMGRFAPPSKRVQVDVRLDEIVLRALEQDPEQRYQHASDVKTDVEFVGRSPVAPLRANEAAKGGVFPIRFWWRDPLDVMLTALGTAWIAGLFWLLPIVVIGFLGPFTGLTNDKVSFIAVMGGSLIFLGVMAVLGLGSLESVRVDADGLTINRYVGPSKFLPWSTVRRIEPISRWEVFRHVYLWLGLPPRASIWCGTSLDYYRIDCQNDCWYFSPRHVRPFLAAINRCQNSINVNAIMEDLTSKPMAAAAARSATDVAMPAHHEQAREYSAEPRLSRSALIGVIWAGLGLPATIILPLAVATTPEGTTPAGILHIPVPLFALFAISAPIGATLLGAVGIARIKRSEGRLYGLRLAQVDALLFPLLLLGLAAFLGGFLIVRGPMRGLPPSAGLDEWFYQSPRQELVALLIALPIWFFPARALFRAVVGPRDAFELRKLPLVGNEPLTGKAALVVALAAIAAHAWPWHWIVMPPPMSVARTISNFDVIDALQSFWLLVLSIGLALFASAASLARPAKLILRIGSVIAVIAALVIQIQFFRSLGEFEPGQPTVARLTRTYSHMGVYVTMALTGLASLFFLLRIFDEPSRPDDDERVRRPIGPEQISLWAAISGVLLPALLLLGGTALSSRVSITDRFVVLCFLPGVGLELVAFGCGLVTRGTKSGKAGLIIGAISLVLCPIPLTIPLRTRDSAANRSQELIPETGVARPFQ